MAHWLELQQSSGWIPREVPLGAEQEVRVPKQFLPQELIVETDIHRSIYTDKNCLYIHVYQGPMPLHLQKDAKGVMEDCGNIF